MRSLSFGLAGLVIAASGCGVLSGLGDYQEMPAADNAALTNPTPEAGTSESSIDPNIDASEDGGADDASNGVDALDLADVDIDAPPPCGPVTCQHCCSNGACVGGQSVNSCGTAGSACNDCTHMGGACTKGSCTSVVVDAAPPPTCNKNSCGGCIPFYQTGCCKSDQTCGCTVSFSGGGCK